MKNDSLNAIEINTIKDEFSAAYLDGKKPTLADFLARYPQYTDELTEFVLTFAELHAAKIEQAAPTKAAEQAFARAMAASRSTARSIAERLSELKMTDAELATQMRVPPQIFSLFHRNHVSGAQAFARDMAKVLSITELQSRKMLAPQVLAYRAKGQSQPQPKTFQALLEDLQAKSLISLEDFEYWTKKVSAE